jgi:BirA family biotin operon repressor/biotin-[acetyl-CoA-carboxylase] ligase
MFDLERLLRTGLVNHVDWHEAIGSTSDRALELAARDNVPLPLLVVAERQTRGRGRGANQWWAGDGALTFSLVLAAEPAQLAPQHRPQVALVAGLALCESLAELHPAALWQVKWPNDVYVRGGKIAGILCESVPGSPERIVVGIGVNVNNSLANAPSELQSSARSLVDESRREHNLTDILASLLDRLDYRWQQMLESGWKVLAPDYRARCLLTNRTVTLQAGTERIVGRARGIDDAGALVLHTESGERKLLAGSVEAWSE